MDQFLGYFDTMGLLENLFRQNIRVGHLHEHCVTHNLQQISYTGQTQMNIHNAWLTTPSPTNFHGE